MFKFLYSVWLVVGGCALYGERVDEMGSLESWHFNIFTFSDEEIEPLVVSMFEKCGYLEKFGIEKKRFFSYVEAVKANYLDNPYHNFHHAAEVTQFIYKMLFDGLFDEKMSEEKCFALMLAALNHDVGHPGKSASFQKALSTDIYLKFGGVSTLEKYHVELAFTLFDDPEFDLFQNLDKSELYPFVEEMILATDIAFHDEILQKIEAGEIDGEARYGILAIKAADLGQLVRAKEISERWVTSLHKEQYLQRAREIEKGIHEEGDEKEFVLEQMKAQANFVKRYAYPLYTLLGESFPELSDLKNKIHSPFIP